MSIHDLVSETNPAVGDEVAIWDASAAHTDKVTLGNLLAAGTVLAGITSYKVGSFSRDTAAATGNVAYTGVGFKPRAIIIFGGISGGSRASWGLDTSLDRGSIYDNFNAVADTWGIAGTFSIFMESGAGNQHAGKILTFDSDGFTISWTKTGTPSSTADFFYLALR